MNERSGKFGLFGYHIIKHEFDVFNRYSKFTIKFLSKKEFVIFQLKDIEEREKDLRILFMRIEDRHMIPDEDHFNNQDDIQLEKLIRAVAFCPKAFETDITFLREPER